MNSAGMNTEVLVERPVRTKDPVTGVLTTTWEPLVAGGERFFGEVVDVPPIRSEAVRQGLQVAKNQTRLRLRWRDDITSEMRVTIYRDVAAVMQIVGGPSEIGGRRVFIELMLERYSK